MRLGILHIAPDEKFIDMGIKSFERVVPGSNKLIIISDDKVLIHVKVQNKLILSNMDVNKKSKDKLFWKDIDILVLHSLCTHNITIPKRVKTIWLGWGYDYYDMIFPYEKLLCKKTLKVFKGLNYYNHSFIIKIIRTIKKLIKKLIFWEKYQISIRNKFIKQIDYFCPVIMTEYNMIKWPANIKPKLMDWNYGTVEDHWGKAFNTNTFPNKKNILLGNSATFTCNHIKGIDYLKDIDTAKSKLIIPLNYGEKAYTNIVKEYAKTNFSGEIVFLDDFLSFDDYVKIIASCSYGIMPHKRQQGLGNILMLLYSGAKVFLDKSNPIYHFLKEKGFFIFELDDLKRPNWGSLLTIKQAEVNKLLIDAIYSRVSIDDKTKKLINVALNNLNSK